MRILGALLFAALGCATPRAVSAPVAAATPVVAPEPARPPTVLYGTGVSSSASLGAVCDRRHEHCAIADLAGRVAVIDRATGSVLATSFFKHRGDLVFDDSGAHLGVGLAEWDWRSGDVRSLADWSCCVALSANRVAWVEGSQFGRDAQIHVRNRIGAASAFSLDLTSAGIKYLEFAGDDLLLVAHTDSVDAYDLAGQRWSLQLEPELAADRWRPYSGNPRLQFTRNRILLKPLPGELRVLTRKLDPIRTLAVQGESVFASADLEQLVRVRPLDGNRVQVDVEETDSGKRIASTQLESSFTLTVRFWRDRLILSQHDTTWLWDLRSAPTKQKSGRPLLVVGDDLLEEFGSVLRFSALDSTQPPREVRTFSAQVLPSELTLHDDHLLVRDGYRLESWGATGVQPASDEGPGSELNRLARNDEMVLEGPAGRLTTIQHAKDDWVIDVAFDAKRTRALVVLQTEWRLYDTTRGTVLKTARIASWPRTVVSFRPSGEAFLVIDTESVTAYSRDGKQLARQRYPLEPQQGMRGGAGEQPTANLVWTSKGVALSLWSEPEVWFLKVPSLKFIARAPGGYAGGLHRLASGVAANATLYSEDGELRAKLPSLRAVSADGTLVAYCSQAAVVVVDEFGKTVDGDASFCDDASALAISRKHLAVVRRGEVRLLRRDDRTTWSARSFHPDRARGFGHRSGDPPPPPSTLLIVQQGDRFGLSALAASQLVTTFGAAREVPMLELTSELWR